VIGNQPDLIERGTIVEVDLPTRGHEQGGRRPAVVISATAMTAGSTLIVVPITASPGLRRPYELQLAPGDSGLEMTSTALVHQMRAIDRRFIVDRGRGRMSEFAMSRLDEVIMRVLGLPMIRPPGR
jgi:mRNA interferase MazF